MWLKSGSYICGLHRPILPYLVFRHLDVPHPRDMCSTPARISSRTGGFSHALHRPGTGAGGAESARTPGMVGRERRGGRQRRAGRAATYIPVQPATSLGEPSTGLADSERARPPRPSPDPASTAATRCAAAVAGRRAAEGFHETRLSRLPARSTPEGSRQPSCRSEHHRNCAYRG